MSPFLTTYIANDVGRKISDAYAGGGVLDRSGFHRLKTGERELKKLHLVHFVVKLGLNDDYARLLSESAGFFLTEKDAVNIRKGRNNDASYLDDYYLRSKDEKKDKYRRRKSE